MKLKLNTMNKKLFIFLIIITLLLLCSLSAVLYIHYPKVKTYPRQPVDTLHTYIPQVPLTREEIDKGWASLPNDADLNAGNIKSPCERSGRSINKTIDGKEYPVFLMDDQLTYGTTTYDGRLARSVYAIHKDSVWYTDFVGCGIIVGADKNTFRSVGYRNAADKNHAYFQYKVVEGADVSTYSMYKDYGQWWTGDKNSTFYKGEKVSSLAGMYEIGGGWLRTDTAIFLGTEPTEVTDPRSFILIQDSQYQKDNEHVYLWGKIIKDADSKTFEQIGSYFKDKNKVYYSRSSNDTYKDIALTLDNVVVPNIDAQTFRVMKENKQYYVDKNGIYVGAGETLTPLPGVDVNTFEILGMCGSVEKSYAYYSKDSSHVYCGTTLIKNADPKTFSIIGTYNLGGIGNIDATQTIAKDKNCLYQQERLFTRADGVCVSPNECAGIIIDEKNGTVCGYSFLMER